MRADARRNQERILRAGNELVMVHGPFVPIDQVAKLAGVGNATLYRHFPTREVLIQEIVFDNIERTIDLVETAVTEEATGWDAVVRFTNDASDYRVVALLPILWPLVAPDEMFRELIENGRDAVEQLLEEARQRGDLRRDVGVGDFILAIATISRPLPGVPNSLSERFRKRHVALLLQGMHASSLGALPGEILDAQMVIDSLDESDSA